MTHKIHHLNCATLCPVGARWLIGPHSGMIKAHMVCHCLLIETDTGLILVDTGFGTKDIKKPRQRLGNIFVTLTRPKLDEAETALRQIQKLGFKQEDVRHIILTHLDIDHAGGISDFPKAQIHLFEEEYKIVSNPTLGDRLRYSTRQWQHQPVWSPTKLEGESWNGFDAIRLFNNKIPDIVMIPLTGHSKGHCGVAIETQNGWLFHCGDAFFHRHQIGDDHLKSPGLLTKLQEIGAYNNQKRQINLDKLKTLHQDKPKDICIFCSHDHQEFHQLQKGLPLDS